MPRRLLLLVSLAVLAAAVGVVVLSSGPDRDGSAPPDPDAAAALVTPQAAAQADRPPAGAAHAGEAGRSGLAPRSGPGAAAEALGAIPAFRGRVLLPDGRPAAGAEVIALGRFGWSAMVDARDPENAPEVSWATTADHDGRFRLPETPRDGMRFRIRFARAGHPPLDLLNLPALPGRTRDLGDVRLLEGFALRGRVEDSDGRPVPGARVAPIPEPGHAVVSRWVRDRLEPLEGYETTSDSDGEFEFTALPPGRIRVRADKAGYAPGDSFAAFGEEGARIVGMVVLLEPSQPVRGVVLDETREPVPGAQLRLDPSHGDRLESETGDDGTFVLDAPRDAARFDLRVAAPGFRSTRLRVEGSERALPLEVRLEPLPALAGHVFDRDGRAVSGAAVALVESRRARGRPGDLAGLEAAAEARTNTQGAFRLVPDLTRSWDTDFLLTAWAEGYGTAEPVPVDLAPGASPPGDLRLRLLPGVEVSGRVLTPHGQPAAEARLYLRKLHPESGRVGRRRLVPETRREGSVYRQAAVGADGSFRFEGLPAGDYRLEAHHLDYSPGESESFALFDLPYRTDVRLHAACGITGRVEGELDLFNPLRVTATAPDADPFDTAVDSRGRFEFERLAPGSYELVLREVDPSFTSQVFTFGQGEGLARASGVEVRAGSSTDVTLELDTEDRAILTGIVAVNGEPSPEIGAYLIPKAADSGRDDPRLALRNRLASIRSAVTDFQGRFRFGGVDSGDYWLVLDRAHVAPRGLFRSSGLDDGGPTGLARDSLRMVGGESYERRFDLQVGRLRGRAYRQGEDGLQPVRGGSGFLEPAQPGSGLATRPLQFRRSGRFEEAWLPAGAWRLTLRGDGHEALGLPVQVPAGETVEIEPLLAPASGSAPKPIQ